MTVAVRMRGELEPIMLEGPFAETVHDLQIAGAKGLEFVVSQGSDGKPVAMAMRNILTIRELDDEDAFTA